MGKTIHIAVLEPSALIFEGLSGIAERMDLPLRMKHIGSVQELEKLLSCHNYELILLNPSYIQHNARQFHSLKKEAPDTRWIGISYAVFDSTTMAFFDEVISITDPLERVASVMRKTPEPSGPKDNENGSLLSEREKEVLQQLAVGLSNKEIADKLNISINTVITHRKNITIKTGIKTVSGLTIYAVVNKLASLDNIR